MVFISLCRPVAAGAKFRDIWNARPMLGAGEPCGLRFCAESDRPRSYLPTRCDSFTRRSNEVAPAQLTRIPAERKIESVLSCCSG